ncbi:MAG: dienelactone hydrolase [Herbaspirillum sp.]|nr:dienelactone hydrolase [Herbaspirillum sp.]
MHAPTINTLLLAGALCLSLCNTQAQTQAKSGASAMPIPVPANSGGKKSGAQNASQSSTQAPAQSPQSPRPQAEKVSFNSSDMQGGKPLSLSAIWVRAAPITTQMRKPTIVAMHSCGGLYSIIRSDNGKNVLTPRTVAMARELRQAGYNVLLPDSLTPRGKTSICTESLQQRGASTAERARDVQAALRWLATQDDVDPDRIALLGWAHGGTAVMQALTMPQERGTLRAKAAIAFYPNCAQFTDTRAAYKPNAPLLILTGEDDDWAPVAPCTALSEKVAAPKIALNVYPDSYHEFDAPGMLMQVRLDVPNPLHPGQGVTSASNPEAKVLAYRDMFAFLAAELK